MKYTILLFSLFWSITAQSQTTPVASKQFSTISDLRAQAGTDKVIVTLSGLTTITDKNGGTYQWDATSVLADDGLMVVKVANVTTGRWIKKLNENTIKGIRTVSGLALTTAYNITYDATLPSIPAMITIQAYSANAAVPSWVSNVTTTGFTVNFASVPILGTNNITFTFLIIKN
ncbi:MAG: hypothetical protein V4608_14825 [Bacteroidota bacterium]